MCLILLAYKFHQNYPLIVAANRDEYFQRPTRNVRWWPELPDLLAGKDLQGGGTWMGITKPGRFAAVTNVREGAPTEKALQSRGQLPLSYLSDKLSDDEFLQRLQKKQQEYPGYNLLFGSHHQLYYFSNRSGGATSLQPGVYGLSNAQLDSRWPKVVEGKKRLTELLQREQISHENIFQLLGDTTTASDSQLPETGVGLEFERLLSAICICGDHYGTRSSSVLFVDRQNAVTLYEKNRAPDRGPAQKYSFQIQNSS